MLQSGFRAKFGSDLQLWRPICFKWDFLVEIRAEFDPSNVLLVKLHSELHTEFSLLVMLSVLWNVVLTFVKF